MTIFQRVEKLVLQIHEKVPPEVIEEIRNGEFMEGAYDTYEDFREPDAMGIKPEEELCNRVKPPQNKLKI